MFPILKVTLLRNTFNLSGKITSVEIKDGGGVIHVSSEAGRYGKVFLTYNVTVNPALPNQGYFSGKGVGFNDGQRQAGNRPRHLFFEFGLSVRI